jgi:AcrR family transcriptional regulator
MEITVKLSLMPVDAQRDAKSHREAAVPDRHFGYKQQRSLETFERLLDAAAVVIAEKSLEDVSVSEICEQAGLSVGAFYRRFQSKDGLLQVLHERYTERVLQLQAVALDPARWEGAPIEEIIVRVIDEIIRTTKQDIGLLRSSTRRAQADPAFARREAQIQSEFFALMTRLLLQRVESIGHPRPRLAAEFCAYQLRAVLLYHLLTSPMLDAGEPMFGDAQFSRELSASLIGYLQVPSDGQPTASSPSARRRSRTPR